MMLIISQINKYIYVCNLKQFILNVPLNFYNKLNNSISNDILILKIIFVKVLMMRKNW